MPSRHAGVNNARQSQKFGTMAKTRDARFKCPHCGAVYKVIRERAQSMAKDRETTCDVCGGPLHGRRGAFIIKYVLVDPPAEPKKR